MSGSLHEHRYTVLIISLSVIHRMENFTEKFVEEIKKKKHFMYHNFLLNVPFVRCVEKYGRAGQATDKNMPHAHCMLETYGYKHTLGICNTYCFSTGTIVTGTRLNVNVICTLSVLFVHVQLFNTCI